MLYIRRNQHASHENNHKYKKYRNVLCRLIRNAKREYISSELKEGDARKTWQILNEVTRGTTCKPTLPKIFKTVDGHQLENPEHISEHFNKYFSKIGKTLKQQIRHCDIDPLKYVPGHPENSLNKLYFTTGEELTSIVNAMRNVGGGHDGINTKLLRATFSSISDELVHFINLCLKTSTFPS